MQRLYICVNSNECDITSFNPAQLRRLVNKVTNPESALLQEVSSTTSVNSGTQLLMVPHPVLFLAQLHRQFHRSKGFESPLHSTNPHLQAAPQDANQSY